MVVWESLTHSWEKKKRDGEEGGRGVQGYELMYTYGGFLSMYGKPIQYCKVKKKKKKTAETLLCQQQQEKKQTEN